jgi:CheY-like chemotaxis protein
VIDDAPELLELFVELLESESYRVTTSLEILTVDDIAAIAPDVIVHDVLFFGDHDDRVWNVLRQTRLDPRLAQVPLILCTADSRIMTDRQFAEHLEKLDLPVILKPFAIETILNVLTDVLEREEPHGKPPGNAFHPRLGNGVQPVVNWSAS